ncbi:TIGR03899 family protein [Thaumasiovibrio subtropicus]|uniref:TIGR03899 family protein n=1 Tax=Thaumasiovibrio subtropicus TaxID=1891207 RepID=UPI000B357E28|nr:TIGR03899 family protein [Thaumasiovibrio subtropicus]
MKSEQVVVATQSSSQSKNLSSSQGVIKQLASEQGIDALISKGEAKALEERVTQRQQLLLQQQQRNLEKIIQIAFQSCKDEVSQRPDPDWYARFLSFATHIHGLPMQQLWAQVLKTEIIQPGTISYKALSVLNNMSKHEAQILQQAASLSCAFGSENTLKIVTGLRSPQGKMLGLFRRPASATTLQIGQYQLPYSSLLVLIDLGLVLSSELVSGAFSTETNTPLHYQDQTWQLRPSEPGITLVYYRFSPTGQELCQLLGKRKHNQYQQALLGILNQAFAVESESSGSEFDAE